MSLKFAANLSVMFQEERSLLNRYELAKAFGFQAVECAFPYDFSIDDIVQAKTKSGLKQVLINAYPGDWGKGDRGLASIPGRNLEFRSSLEKSMNYAKKLNCKRIHLMAGSPEKKTEENLFSYMDNLKIAAEILSENSLIGLIEPISKYTLANYFLDDFQKAISVLKEINSPSLRLQLDIFHLQHISGDLTNNIQNLLPLVGHIQVAQAPNRNEPSSPGEIDYKYIFSLLDKFGYKDWIGLEYTPKTTTVESLKWIRDWGYTL